MLDRRTMIAAAIASATAFSRAGAAQVRGRIAQEIDRRLALAQAHETLNAFVTLDVERVKASAYASDLIDPAQLHSKPLYGMILAIKDNIDVSGYPTTACTPALRDYRPERTAQSVLRLQAAGGIVFAKAGMHELAFGSSCANPVYGNVYNPYGDSLSPGGSSGGTAVAIAAGIVDAGLGTDTAGSTRMPASLCGIVGFRPSMGRYPDDGVVPLALSRDTIGPMARDVGTIIKLDQVLTKERSSDFAPVDLARLRVGLVEPFWRDLDPRTENACRAALEKLRANGVTVIAAPAPYLDAVNAASSTTILLHEAVSDLTAWLAIHRPGMNLDGLVEQIANPHVEALYRAGIEARSLLSLLYPVASQVHRPSLRRMFSEIFEQNKLDALVFPTTPLPASLVREDGMVTHLGRDLPEGILYPRNLDAGAVAGLPGISLPVAEPGALPIGLEIQALPGADARLLEIARMVEQVVSTASRASG